MEPSDRVTIRDVARRAGVSISTVSHTLSARRPISPATRERVLAAAAELGYHANAVASSLRRGRTQLMGLVLRPKDAIRGTKRGTDNFLQLIGSVVTTALDDGWGVVHIPNDSNSYSSELPVDGYIVAHPYADDPVLASLRQRRVPLVVIDPVDQTSEDWSVQVDYASGIRNLLDTSRKPNGILLLPGTENNLWNSEATQTVTTWCNATGTPLIVKPTYEGTGADGAVQAFQSLHLPAAIDSIITGPSAFAAGLITLQQARTMRIAALTDSPVARTSGITTLDIRLHSAGATAVNLLARRLASQAGQTRVITDPEIQWRDSWPHQESAGGR